MDLAKKLWRLRWLLVGILCLQILIGSVGFLTHPGPKSTHIRHRTTEEGTGFGTSRQNQKGKREDWWVLHLVVVMGSQDWLIKNTKKENEQLQLKLHRPQIRMKFKPATKGSKKSSEMTVVEWEARKKTQKELRKICKFFKNEKKLHWSTECVLF